MRFGAAYYPEHVAPERWAVDAQLMVQAGLSVIRIGEFAWCRMEPREDEFTLDWMEQTLAVFAARGIAVIIGTPTAGPPAWLVNAPTEAADCRQVYENGQRWEFGGRSLCCVNHPRFAARSIAISTALAKRFANHPAVVGFQLDNELGMFGPRCFCATCVSEFRQWMRRKYASIDAVNQRLGMIFGGGEFGSFDDIPLPRQSQDLHNPGLRLDALRFVSDSACTYLRAQVSALRANGVSQPITTNSCHMFGGWLDYDQTTLWSLFDVVGFDCYPSQFGTTPSPNTIGLLHAIARAGKPGTPHWMLEQQAGSPMEMAFRNGRPPACAF